MLRNTQAAIAGKNLIDIMHEASIRNGENNLVPRPDFDSPEKSVKDLHGHPSLQCRLDTFLAGALCPLDEKLTAGDTVRGNCLPSKYPLGARPRCWFGNNDNK